MKKKKSPIMYQDNTISNVLKDPAKMLSGIEETRDTFVVRQSDIDRRA